MQKLPFKKYKTVRGFSLLLLGWTDGYSFLSVAFNMLASAKEEKRINPANGSIDRRTNDARAWKDAIMKKMEAAIALIHAALEAGIEASCVLMDTWFTNEPFIHAVLGEGLTPSGWSRITNSSTGMAGKCLASRTWCGICKPTQTITSSALLLYIYRLKKQIHFYNFLPKAGMCLSRLLVY